MVDPDQTMPKQWAKVVAMAWADDGFKERLMADPKTVLAENGIRIPENISVKITEGDVAEITFAVPPKPSGFTGSVEELSERLQTTPSWCCFSGSMAS